MDSGRDIRRGFINDDPDAFDRVRLCLDLACFLEVYEFVKGGGDISGCAAKSLDEIIPVTRGGIPGGR